MDVAAMEPTIPDPEVAVASRTPLRVETRAHEPGLAAIFAPLEEKVQRRQYGGDRRNPEDVSRAKSSHGGQTPAA
jgi:hypothetical protein